MTVQEEKDIGSYPRPFTEGMIVVYSYDGRKYVGKVLQAGFHLLLVEELTVRHEQHYICYTDIEWVKA